MSHITFIHGIANKPPEATLLRIWENALARDNGIDLNDAGVTTTMVYWANLLYAEPASEDAYESASILAGPEVAVSREEVLDLSWRGDLSPEERVLVDRLATRLNLEAMADEEVAPPEATIGIEYERIPLPGWLKKRMMAALLRDVHHYLFNVQFSPRSGESYRLQEVIRQRLVTALQDGASKPGPHVLISHSMGTVIAYDCLKRVPDCPMVDALMTIGSPLGFDEIQDQFHPEWTRHDGFPSARLHGRWINVYDCFDPVAGFAPHLINDFQRHSTQVIEDINEQNWGRWRHDITKYLSGQQLRSALSALLQL